MRALSIQTRRPEGGESMKRLVLRLLMAVAIVLVIAAPPTLAQWNWSIPFGGTYYYPSYGVPQYTYRYNYGPLGYNYSYRYNYPSYGYYNYSYPRYGYYYNYPMYGYRYW
jgi:hypothetical protein